MARACACIRSPAPFPKTPAARSRGSARWRPRARGLRRRRVVRPARRGFRPFRAPRTRAPAPDLNSSSRLDLKTAARYILRASKKHPMTDRTLNIAAAEPADPLTGRRVLFTAIVPATMVGLVWLLAFALTAGGFGMLDFILVRSEEHTSELQS